MFCSGFDEVGVAASFGSFEASREREIRKGS